MTGVLAMSVCDVGSERASELWLQLLCLCKTRFTGSVKTHTPAGQRNAGARLNSGNQMRDSDDLFHLCACVCVCWCEAEWCSVKDAVIQLVSVKQRHRGKDWVSISTWRCSICTTSRDILYILRPNIVQQCRFSALILLFEQNVSLTKTGYKNWNLAQNVSVLLKLSCCADACVQPTFKWNAGCYSVFLQQIR